MPFHHIAVATKDMPAIDAFYGEATGFELVKVEIAPTPEGGWAKHFFYDTGNGEMMAFWELHDDTIGKDYRMHEIRVDRSNTARMHGVIEESVFYLVWLDRKHEVFPWRKNKK